MHKIAMWAALFVALLGSIPPVVAGGLFGEMIATGGLFGTGRIAEITLLSGLAGIGFLLVGLMPLALIVTWVWFTWTQHREPQFLRIGSAILAMVGITASIVIPLMNLMALPSPNAVPSFLLDVKIFSVSFSFLLGLGAFLIFRRRIGGI